ncbi:MAG: aromatic amino acid transport family protein [Candidatus Paracaedibacteraceae bacterium]|nr:aromatic amino acid transport family protein [Candidatus Paracaedibacteraceae bacterium]
MNQRILGAIFLIGGTTIGAGMLALPMTSSNFGFYKSIGLLVGMWLYMLIAAIIMVEISHGKGQSIAALSEKHLGKPAKLVAASSMLVLFWSLLWCYISGGSSILHQELGGAIPVPALIIGFTVFLGVFVTMCTSAVDYANRFVLFFKVAIFAVIVAGILPFVQTDNLAKVSTNTHFSFYYAIPIYFTSFAFHGSIPSLISYLDGNKKSIYKSLIIGSLLPLAGFTLWQLITLGTLGGTLTGTEDVGVFISRLTEKSGNIYLSFLTNAFALTGMASSFLGVALGLFDYISEWFGKKSDLKTRINITTLTFGLPLILALIYPKGFIAALGCAAVALSLLAIVLPCLVAFKEKNSSSFFLNKGLIAIMLLGGLAIIAIEVITKS